ncbi:hypothetical protein E2C01_004914 [Portunus trituberculatus]|uniref:Uncharacterized protein n=1 Tax=Portunus trituberculatus TaxID=210409 RepID=A0A5B7CV74_PORTR|nr:hypothetical protein [Portunus trituberculatus]
MHNRTQKFDLILKKIPISRTSVYVAVNKKGLILPATPLVHHSQLILRCRKNNIVLRFHPSRCPTGPPQPEEEVEEMVEEEMEEEVTYYRGRNAGYRRGNRMGLVT